MTEQQFIDWVNAQLTGIGTTVSATQTVVDNYTPAAPTDWDAVQSALNGSFSDLADAIVDLKQATEAKLL